jgi:quercetin dioxygenase-like cupin family protein
MKLLRFDSQVGRAIDRYDSTNLTITRIIQTADESSLICMYLAADGLVGYHQATENQLFLVVQGEGWVRGEADERIPIVAGEAAFWEAGEWHEAGSKQGLTAIVIESKGLDPVQTMSPR